MHFASPPGPRRACQDLADKHQGNPKVQISAYGSFPKLGVPFWGSQL